MTDEPRPTGEQTDSRRLSEPMMLALIGLAIAVLLFAASALPVLLGDNDDEVDSLAIRPAVTVSVAPDATTPSSESSAGGAASSSTAPEPPSTATSVADGAATTTAGSAGDGSTEPTTNATGASSAATVPVGTVPESRATVLAGKIYLEGAVPTEAARDEIVALAAEVLGPANVVDGYTIDPRASDPNLGQVLVADAVLFRTDSAVIAPEFEPLLNQGLALLTIRPAARFVIIGHTDSRGSVAYNDKLSEERALSIVRWYEERGIDRSRLSAIGRGSREPIASDDTPEGRQQNRRIEVIIENLLSDAG